MFGCKLDRQKGRSVMKENNGKGTFVVRIQYTQNNSWQGSITWTEKNMTEHFRSALEMMQLMHNALGECTNVPKVSS